MKINSFQGKNLQRNNVKQNKAEKSIQNQKNIECKSSDEALKAYNLAFSGLFKKPDKDVKKLLPTHYVVEDFEMNPLESYRVDYDTEFDIVGNKFKLSDDWIKPTVDSLKPNENYVLGRKNFTQAPNAMEISSRHLLLGRDKDGNLFAQDINSTNGTRILKNTVCPEKFNNEFILLKETNYYLPQNTILRLSGDTTFHFSDYSKYFNKLKEGQKIIVGRGEDCNIRLKNDTVSRKHFSVEKCKNGYVVKDLNSTNGVTFIGQDKPDTKLPYDRDCAFIQTPQFLLKGERTLLPNNCQLVLNSNYTIDLRNSKLQEILDKKGKALIGKSRRCDIVVENFYDVADAHVYVEKDGDSLFATDYSNHGRVDVIPQESIKPFANGVDYLEFSQSNVGDCYLLSTLYALSCTRKGQKILNNMVSVDRNGNYWVSFYNRDPIKVTIDELDGQKAKNNNKEDKKSVKGDLGLKAIERAYGKMVKSFDSMLTMMADIDNGGTTKTALKKLCGASSTYYALAFHNTDTILQKIAYGDCENMVLTCATPNKAKYGDYCDEYHRFINRHAYAIKNVDARTRTIDIVNPHNTKYSYEISWDEFDKYFESITVGKFNE